MHKYIKYLYIYKLDKYINTNRFLGDFTSSFLILNNRTE